MTNKNKSKKIGTCGVFFFLTQHIINNQMRIFPIKIWNFNTLNTYSKYSKEFGKCKKEFIEISQLTSGIDVNLDYDWNLKWVVHIHIQC